MNASDIALIFPPLWYYLHIPQELVTLAGYLRANGVTAKSYDLNARSADHFLSRPYLEQIIAKLLAEHDRLAQAGNLSNSDFLRLAALRSELPPAPLLAERLGDARQVFRDPNLFYDLSQHSRAAWIINRCWRLISLAHAPTIINFHTFAMANNHQDLQACLMAARDTTHNPYIEYFREVIVPELTVNQPLCIALIYVHPDQMIPLLSLVVALRDAGCRAHICILGSLEDQVSFTRYVRESRRDGYEELFSLIDSVILYEGEQALLQLVHSLRSGSPMAAIANLVRWQAGQVRQPDRVEVLDLNSIPTPDYTDIDLSLYWFPEPVFAMLSSRGCYWGRCSFCAITTNQLSYRARSLELVLQDIAQLQARHGVRWFQFRDMLMSPAYLRRFSQALIAHQFSIRWTCRARFEESLSSEILDMMARAGCMQIWFGFETANEQTLSLMDKGTELSVVDRILDDCEAAGIGVHMLTMHGFPTETPDAAEETVAFLEQRASRIDSFSYTDYVLFGDTPVYQHPKRFGIELELKVDFLLQYRFEHLSEAEREESQAHYHGLRQRLIDALPMPLLHLTHIALYREQLGSGSWKHAFSATPPTPSVADLSSESRFAWTFPTSWLRTQLGVESDGQASLVTMLRRTRSVIALAQVHHDARVYLDERMSFVLDSLETQSLRQITGLLIARADLDLPAAAFIVYFSVKSLLEAGFLVVVSQ